VEGSSHNLLYGTVPELDWSEENHTNFRIIFVLNAIT